MHDAQCTMHDAQRTKARFKPSRIRGPEPGAWSLEPRAWSDCVLLRVVRRRDGRDERGELCGEDRGDGLGRLVAFRAVAHLGGEHADAAVTGDDWGHDGAGERVVGRDGPQLALSVRRRCGVVGIAADAAHPREHVWRVALGEDGKQRGTRAIGHPDDQAGRIDDAGRAFEQPRELRRVAYTCEVGAEAGRGGEID